MTPVLSNSVLTPLESEWFYGKIIGKFHTKMKKNTGQVQTDLPFSPLELVEVIYVSELPEPKKLAYLSTIADGTFSMTHFDRLLADLDQVKSGLERKKNHEEKSLRDLEQEKAELERELATLEHEAAEEQFKNVEMLLQAASVEAEQFAEESKQKTLKTIQKKLQKK